MLCWQDIVYTEVCDPRTMRRVRYGERGTPVYTHLERTSQPMIRLVSGDLTVWTERAESLRPHLSAAAAGNFRPDRRHVHHPRRERLSERNRRGFERAARLRRRASHSSSPAKRPWTSFCFGSKPMRRPTRRATTQSRRSARKRNGSCRRCSACAPSWKSSNPARSRGPTSRRGASSTTAKVFARHAGADGKGAALTRRVPSADLVARVQAGDRPADRPPDLAGGAWSPGSARGARSISTSSPGARTSSASPACRGAASRPWSPS